MINYPEIEPKGRQVSESAPHIAREKRVCAIRHGAHVASRAVISIIQNMERRQELIELYDIKTSRCIFDIWWMAEGCGVTTIAESKTKAVDELIKKIWVQK